MDDPIQFCERSASRCTTLLQVQCTHVEVYNSCTKTRPALWSLRVRSRKLLDRTPSLDLFRRFFGRLKMPRVTTGGELEKQPTFVSRMDLGTWQRE